MTSTEAGKIIFQLLPSHIPQVSCDHLHLIIRTDDFQEHSDSVVPVNNLKEPSIYINLMCKS